MQTGERWTAERYRKYLASDGWKRRRDARSKLAIWRGGKFACEWCGSLQDVVARHPDERRIFEPRRIVFTNKHTHHVCYDRIGDEHFADLIVICRGCHNMLHKFINRLVEKFKTNRRVVMEKLKPYCVRRLLKVHAFWIEADNSQGESF